MNWLLIMTLTLALQTMVIAVLAYYVSKYARGHNAYLAYLRSLEVVADSETMAAHRFDNLQHIDNQLPEDLAAQIRTTLQQRNT